MSALCELRRPVTKGLAPWHPPLVLLSPHAHPRCRVATVVTAGVWSGDMLSRATGDERFRAALQPRRCGRTQARGLPCSLSFSGSPSDGLGCWLQGTPVGSRAARSHATCRARHDGAVLHKGTPPPVGPCGAKPREAILCILPASLLHKCKPCSPVPTALQLTGGSCGGRAARGWGAGEHAGCRCAPIAAGGATRRRRRGRDAHQLHGHHQRLRLAPHRQLPRWAALSLPLSFGTMEDRGSRGCARTRASHHSSEPQGVPHATET